MTDVSDTGGQSLQSVSLEEVNTACDGELTSNSSRSICHNPFINIWYLCGKEDLSSKPSEYSCLLVFASQSTSI